MSYMSKKTQKRQTTIISLSDRNQQELQDINNQKEQLIKDYGHKKDSKFHYNYFIIPRACLYRRNINKYYYYYYYYKFAYMAK
jgi:hypothetical protein